MDKLIIWITDSNLNYFANMSDLELEDFIDSKLDNYEHSSEDEACLSV